MENEQENNSEVFQQGRWNQQEQNRFVLGVMTYGKDWKKVQQIVKSRNGSQVRSHAQKFFLKIIKMIKQQKKMKKRGKGKNNTQSQQQFVNLFQTNFITKKTPNQIISLLKVYQITGIDFKQFSNQKIDDKKQNHQQIQINVNSKQLQQDNSQVLNSHHSFQYSQRQNVQNQSNFKSQTRNQYGIDSQQSFFMFFLRTNIDHLSTNCDFADFIDFKRQPTSNPQNSPRKRSFQIPNQQYDQQKLQKTLQGLRADMGKRTSY